MKRASSIAVIALIAACSGQKMATQAPDPSIGTASGPGAVNLPCEAAQLLAARCWTCHGTTPVDKSPMSLLTYADLKAPSVTHPDKTMAQEAVTRMQDTAMPMPPAPSQAVPADQLAAFQAWVDGGTHGGSCVAPDPFDTPSVCTSGSTWDNGDQGSSRMHPGVACIDCHTYARGPRFGFAGTVFASAHEPDDCYGQGSVQVVIIGADGKTLSMNANSAGNFYTKSSVALPYTAKIVSGGNERAMATPQMSGDCNSCHTEGGDMLAPGRIVAP